MDNAEAKAIVEAELARLRLWPFEQLRTLIGRDQHDDIAGPSGVVYQVETCVFWDAEPGGPIHVLVAADDRGWRAFAPLTMGFIKAPDGGFVGE